MLVDRRPDFEGWHRYAKEEKVQMLDHEGRREASGVDGIGSLGATGDLEQKQACSSQKDGLIDGAEQRDVVIAVNQGSTRSGEGNESDG